MREQGGAGGMMGLTAHKKNPAEGGAQGLNVSRESVLVSTLAWRSALLTRSKDIQNSMPHQGQQVSRKSDY